MVDLSLFAANNRAMEKLAKANRKAIAKHNHSRLQEDEHAKIRNGRRTVNLLKLADKRDELAAARQAKSHVEAHGTAWGQGMSDVYRAKTARLKEDEAKLANSVRVR